MIEASRAEEARKAKQEAPADGEKQVVTHRWGWFTHMQTPEYRQASQP
jgi:hypothetical protein